MFVLLFAKDIDPSLDLMKMLKLALIHDLVEIYAGDTFAFDDAGQLSKEDRERAAAQKLFSQLPSDFAQEFTALFEEYEVGVTTESKIVSSFDKLQPILQNLCSEGKGWKKHNLSWEQVDRYKRKHMEHHPLILQMYEQLMMEAKERGWL